MHTKLDQEIVDILCCPMCKGAFEIANGEFICQSCAAKFVISKKENILDLRVHYPEYCVPSGMKKWSDIQNGYDLYENTMLDHDNLKTYLNEIDTVKEVYGQEFDMRGKVLDVGGHQGRLRHFLDKKNVPLYVSIDPFIGIFQKIEECPNLLKAYPCLTEPCNFLAAHAERLPFKNNSFDWVHMRSALDHFEDPYLALKEAYRVLNADGRLMIGMTISGGKSSMKREDSASSLMIKIKNKISRDGLIAFLKVALVAAKLKIKGVDEHAFRLDYDSLMDLLNVSGFEITKEHWQKPPFSMCLYITAKKKAA